MPIIACIILFSLILELSLGQTSICAPILAASALYFAVTYPIQKTCLLLLTAFILLDLGYGRPLPLSLLQLLLIFLFAALWRRHGSTRKPLLQLFSGLFLGGITLGTHTLHLLFSSGCLSAELSSKTMITACISTPLVLFTLEHFSIPLGIHPYSKS